MNAKTIQKPLDGKLILLGVTGSVAAYKAADIASRLTQLGARVYAVLTKNACEFVSPLTFRALTGNPTLTGVFDEPHEAGIAHVDIPSSADLLLIAPATANIIGKLAHGIADDWLSTAALVVTCPVIIAPAMNSNMFANHIVQENIARLKSIGHGFVGPCSGHLACGADGQGRLVGVESILDAVSAALSDTEADLAGMNLLVTAGPTREPIDPVRFISNYSSGKMGYAIAEAAARRGAKVTLISGPTELPTPQGVKLVPVETAKEMLEAATANFADADVVICAAAVADYAPASQTSSKIKKTGDSLLLELKPTNDILKSLGKVKKKRIMVGFAAETENLIENATAKLKDKNLDLIVANNVFQDDAVFGSDMNAVSLITSDGAPLELPRMTKREVADNVLGFVKQHYWRTRA